MQTNERIHTIDFPPVNYRRVSVYPLRNRYSNQLQPPSDGIPRITGYSSLRSLFYYHRLISYAIMIALVLPKHP